MKNKKLFAILTLVCFMFTLMPVAAFAATPYAAVDEQDAYVTVGASGADATIVLNGYDAADDDYVAYALVNGAFSKDFGFQVLSPVGDATSATADVHFAKPGTYEIHVVNKVDTVTATIINAAGEVQGTLSNAQAVTLLEDKSTVVMLDKEVVVGSPAATYAVTAQIGMGDVYDADATAAIVPTVDLDADSAFSTADVWVALTANGQPVVGQTLKISTNSAAVETDKTTVTTNGAGMAKFSVSASVKGAFKVYVEFGNMAEEVITVNAGALAPSNIKTIKEPTAPVAQGSDITAAKVQFSVTDANGNAAAAKLNAITNGSTDNYKVVVLEKPVGSAVKGSDYDTNYAIDAQGYLTNGVAAFDKAGTYTFKVVLDNGAYALATVEVKAFQKPVALQLTYKQTAVELNGEAILDEVVYVDANGVTKDASSEVILSATGYAIDNFTNADGKVVVKDDEKYVGSKIVVTAVSERYNLVDTVELTVANEAVAVKYLSTKADVGVNNTLVANIVDMDGNKVALNATDATAAVQYIVLEKPADAKVAISTIGAVDPTTGKFNVSFTASAAGEYKLQTIVRYNQNTEVVKYYSGTETIVVGATGIDDVVVMSVGSNQIVKNDEVATMIAAPIVKDARTFVPFRALSEAFGAEVAWDEATQAVTAELDGTTVVLTIGSANYTVNGVVKAADVAPFIDGSSTMVPVRFVAEAFGIKVTPTYDANGATADILFAK